MTNQRIPVTHAKDGHLICQCGKKYANGNSMQAHKTHCKTWLVYKKSYFDTGESCYAPDEYRNADGSSL